MIAHVWERALEAGAQEVVVATDDERIGEVVHAFGGRAVMTSIDHASGTDRLAQVARDAGWADDAIVVNLQGDEPLMPGQLVAKMAAALAVDPSIGISTLAAPIHDAAELFNPNAVKVVLDAQSCALYFSRAPIPWARDAWASAPGVMPHGVTYLRHLGLYGYRVATLMRLARTAPVSVEKVESLEQLRALALGIRIHVTTIAEPPPPGVDTEEDRKRVEIALRG
jgi:3-deoxy-manno-octulosonate cytidylyltransferase (CMP-KDO synthetase)